MKGAIRKNLLTERIDIVKPLGWYRDSPTLTDVDVKYLLLYFEENYGLTVEKKIIDAVAVIANENRYHPVCDFLNALQWDGTELIETVYRHQSVSMLEFTDYFFLSKMGRIFYKDWSAICFMRELSATKGVKISQLEKAREIHRLGTTRYKERYKRMFLDGKLTKKQWETIRNFAKAWPAEREKYVEEVGKLEKEFKDRLLSNFQIGIFTPVRRKL